MGPLSISHSILFIARPENEAETFCTCRTVETTSRTTNSLVHRFLVSFTPPVLSHVYPIHSNVVHFKLGEMGQNGGARRYQRFAKAPRECSVYGLAFRTGAERFALFISWKTIAACPISGMSWRMSCHSSSCRRCTSGSCVCPSISSVFYGGQGLTIFPVSLP